jgi:outer membrane receptor protein involved in Fe transport
MSSTFVQSLRQALLCLALLAAAVPASAQLTRGIISGVVTDSGGGVLPGATVTITNQDTGVVRATTSNDSGVFRAPALEPGTYQVRAELQGFRTFDARDIRVGSGQEVTLNPSLSVGGLEETVQVTSEAAGVTINRTNATVGLVTNARQVVELPISPTRDVTRVALLSPNVVSGPGAEGISANGQRSRNNNFMIDGSDNNDASVSLSTTPIPPEAVAEVAVQTNPYNVEYGRSSGAQFNVITKSGTNAFRGDIFDYYTDSKYNARTNVEKRTGFDDPAGFTRHQVGGGIGGPIAKNRLFFFGMFQADIRREDGGPGTTANIPTQAGYATLQNVPLRAGQSAASRAAVLNSIGFLQEVYAQNPVFSNLRTTNVNGVPVEIGQVNLPIQQDRDAFNLLTRVDYTLSPNDTITGRYISDRPTTQNAASNLQFGSRFAGESATKDHNLALSHTHVFGPRALNEARFSYIRRDLSFPEADPVTPTTAITGLFTIGGLSNFPQGRIQNSFQFQDVFSWQKGRHSLKFGGDMRYLQLDNQAAFNSKGSFTFNNLQDYMNNFANQFTQALQVASFDARQTQLYFFAQDDFRVTQNLTLNLGLRYENSSVPLGFFGAEDQESLNALVPGPVQRDNNNWAPRVGFAWTPTPQGGFLKSLLGAEGQSVVRGGYGIGYDVLFYNILTVNASNFPRVFTGLTNQIFDVFPNVAPVGGAPVFNALATYVNTPVDAQYPRSNYWSLSFARELTSNTSFEFGYNGSLSRNGVNQLQANPAVLTEAQAATVRATGNIASIPNTQARRVFPQFGSRVLIATTAEGEYHSAYAQFTRRLARGLQFRSSYTFSKNFSNNDESLGVAAITAGSPQIPQDFNDIDAEWSLSAFDRTHRVVASWLYETPAVGNALVRQLTGGWQVSGVFVAQSGQPFTIVTGVDTNGNGGGGDRPNFDPSGTLTPDPDTGNLRTFTTSGMFLVPLGSNGLPLANSLGNGNLGRNTLRAPAWYNWDISVARRFTLPFGHRVLIRADLFNAFNQDNYGVPVNSLSNPAFGTNTNNWGNRSLLMSARYSF